MTELATFGAGCFWGVESVFRKVPGVVNTAVGFMGGTVENPTYEQVCKDTTGHAEVVRVAYNPEEVTYGELLQVFWDNHDPTQINRQGPDVGTQYRSVVFAHTDEQEQDAHAAIDALTELHAYDRPIATVVEPAREFYKAEEYHQRYLEKQGRDSCHI